MKIIRANVNGTNVYIKDDTQGLEIPKVDARLWGMYQDALHIINVFEQEVDKIYENQSPSSAPSNR